MHFINPDETFDIVVHRVGNRTLEEGVHLSKTLTFYPPEISENLYTFFTKSFRTDEYFHFYQDEEVNIVKECVKEIFSDPTQLLQQSIHIANQLYKASGHTKVKGGELFVVYFPDALFEGENTPVVGVFKNEMKETFLKVMPTENAYNLQTDFGTSLSKIEKGCLIFNLEQEEGYIIANVDNSKGEEIGAWSDNFLGIIQRKDEFFDTESTLELCKTYVLEKMPEEFEVQKIDQVDLLNRSVHYFKENETFELDQFKEKVLGQEELKQSFDAYKKRYEDAYDVELNDHFEISKNAVKKQSRFFKSIIKLDKNFHIYVHGNRQMIEQGTDEEGKKFYKLYYDAEN